MPFRETGAKFPSILDQSPRLTIIRTFQELYRVVVPMWMKERLTASDVIANAETMELYRDVPMCAGGVDCKWLKIEKPKKHPEKYLHLEGTRSMYYIPGAGKKAK